MAEEGGVSRLESRVELRRTQEPGTYISSREGSRPHFRTLGQGRGRSLVSLLLLSSFINDSRRVHGLAHDSRMSETG